MTMQRDQKMTRDQDINRQISNVRDDRMMLRDRLAQMQPTGWTQDAGMNEVPVWSAAQQLERQKIERKLQDLAEAERALYRL